MDFDEEYVMAGIAQKLFVKKIMNITNKKWRHVSREVSGRSVQCFSAGIKLEDQEGYRNYLGTTGDTFFRTLDQGNIEKQNI